MNLNLAEVETCLTGAAVTPGAVAVNIAGARTDSRLVGPGDLFFCITGERMDGHNFAVEAARRGAAAIVAERLVDAGDAPVLMVRDSVQALGRLARCLREKTSAKVVAVTGSAGKTTVKELLASLLSVSMPVSRNPGNFNNQIGVPLSIFEAGQNDGAWVLEAGISKPTDMDELGFIIAPDVAVLTNVAAAHTQGLGDLRGVAKAKARLLAHLREDGRALVCSDYPELWEQAVALRPDAMAYSAQDPGADVSCHYLGSQAGENGRLAGRFALKLPTFSAELDLGFTGRHFAENIAAAAGAAFILGLSSEDILKGLSRAEPCAQRFCQRKVAGVTLVDDTYNANPLSMERAIQAARELAGRGPLVLVLGEMLELGELARVEHENLGRFSAMAEPDMVLFHGEHAGSVARGLELAGRPGVFAEAGTPDAAARRLAALELEGGVVLFKGSRGRRMETFLAAATESLGR
ncbi:MAG: UDP-N-acetylmuramoyl-tripeptide--D-alanyl-D-alanine ligase [Desulfovibrionaceae bacterium]